MQFEMMMMTKGMGTVLIEEVGTCHLIGEAMIMGDPQVHIVGIGLAQTTAMEVPDLKLEEVPSMIELKAQSMGDMTGSYLSQVLGFLYFSSGCSTFC